MYPKITSQQRETALREDLLNLLPRELVQELQFFVFEKNPEVVKIATVNPENAVLKKYAKESFGKKIHWFTATNEDVAYVLKNYRHDFKEDILKLVSGAVIKNENIAKIVDNIIKYAFAEKASDIHIEPSRNEFIARFRIDGALHNILNLPRNIYPPVIARFKILANLKIDEYRRPQDGRIELEDLPDTSLRVSTMPTLFGEKIALRILDESHKNISIGELGFLQNQQDIIARNIEKPFGMIVVSGPTGAGKTTTLYSLLQLLKRDDLNISTLEDPIEYVLAGVNQIQVNPGANLTFASGLRSLLRQDPDILMVGEIRDSETAVMAANAAMTGHLVFTTIHTNDAPSAFTRFLEMGVEDFIVSSTINLVIAQRLVRRICGHCSKEQPISNVVLKKIKERKDIIAALEAKERGLFNALKEYAFPAGEGCDRCFKTGYLGRVGIFELLEPDRKIRDLALGRESADKIRAAAEKNMFRSMISDGIDKVFNGITTFDEVLRTTKHI